jgi:hypothetical protein
MGHISVLQSCLHRALFYEFGFLIVQEHSLLSHIPLAVSDMFAKVPWPETGWDTYPVCL